MAYSPNGLYLATGSDDYSVAIWDVATGERVLHTLTGHGGYVRIINWSSDSKMIISGALDNVIRIFDVETGISLCEPLMGHKGYLSALSFRSSLHGNEPEVVSGALHLFSFVCQFIDSPSASLDGTVRVWELRKGFFKAQTFSGFHGDWVCLHVPTSATSSLLSRYTLFHSLPSTISLLPVAMMVSWS